MRTIILILVLSPFFSFSQTVSVYIKLTDSRNQPIAGTAVTKGFEGWIQASSTNAGGKNSTDFSFTMPVSGASADIKKAMATGQLLAVADVRAISPNSMGSISMMYTVRMEQVTVLACTETMGCNGAMNTSVSLQALRIGWTYYNTNPKGSGATVSRKFGWDAGAQAEWTNF
jgi:type VI protein secretion system component Hcp